MGGDEGMLLQVNARRVAGGGAYGEGGRTSTTMGRYACCASAGRV